MWCPCVSPDYNTSENDQIGLINGLSYNDLDIESRVIGEENATFLRLRSEQEDFLAIVIGVENLDRSDFKII